MAKTTIKHPQRVFNKIMKDEIKRSLGDITEDQRIIIASVAARVAKKYAIEFHLYNLQKSVERGMVKIYRKKYPDETKSSVRRRLYDIDLHKFYEDDHVIVEIEPQSLKTHFFVFI